MTASGLTAPVHLNSDHVLDMFDCGIAPLNDWLKRQARKNEASGASRTYVVCAGNVVVAYYCLSAGAINRTESPKPMQRNMPDPIPVMVMGRLAVDHTMHGRGIGSPLLRDAVLRVLHAAEQVGVKALLVHAISDDARRFYLDRGFVASPTAPMTLCLVLASARNAIASG
jgi:GNAT superfamily N-acetyltransferase